MLCRGCGVSTFLLTRKTVLADIGHISLGRGRLLWSLELGDIAESVFSLAQTCIQLALIQERNQGVSEERGRWWGDRIN